MHDRLLENFVENEDVNDVLDGTVLQDLLQNGRMANTCDIQQKIGRGGFGAVFHVTDKDKQTPSAIKVVPLSIKYSELDSVANNSAFREVVSTLRDLNPMHVVQLYGHWLEEPDALPDEVAAACDYFWDDVPVYDDPNNQNGKDNDCKKKEKSKKKKYSQMSATDVIRNANAELRENMSVHYVSTHHYSSVGLSKRFDGYDEDGDSEILPFRTNHSGSLRTSESSWGSLGFEQGIPSETPKIPVGRALSDPLLSTTPLVTQKSVRFQQTQMRAHEPGTINKFIKVVLIIQMELCSKTDNIDSHMTLRDWLHRPRKKEADEKREVVDVLSHFLLSVRHIHRKRLLHSDIKPENIFVSSVTGQPLRVRLADFGMSCSLKERCQSIGGTPLYTPPDATRTEKSDMFSCGVVIFECLYYRFVNQSPSRMERAKILEEFVTNGTIPLALQRLPKLALLMQGMCNSNQNLRLNAEDACKQLKDLKSEIMRAHLSGISEQYRDKSLTNDSSSTSNSSHSRQSNKDNGKGREGQARSRKSGYRKHRK